MNEITMNELNNIEINNKKVEKRIIKLLEIINMKIDYSSKINKIEKLVSINN